MPTNAGAGPTDARDDVPEHGFTLHVAGPGDLDRLGRTMANCLASYGKGRTRTGNRIVEVRWRGQTRYAVHVRAGAIVQFEAPGNRTPTRHDVPIVRALLEQSGLLAKTTEEAALRRAAAAGQPRATPAPRRRATPRRRARRPRRVVREPGISVQELAAELLRPQRSPEAPEWCELAAALWATGRLPRLVDPTETLYEQVVLDLAATVATGDDPRLDRVRAPAADEVRAARERLLAAPAPTSGIAWQRRRMAEVLAAPLRP